MVSYIGLENLLGIFNLGLNWAIIVAATFRLRNLLENLINPSDDKKRRLKPSATVTYNMKSLNSG